MQQLIQPNLYVVGKVGFCLQYARQVFAIGVVYPTAQSAWNNAQYKHLDRNLPNVAVPCWFSFQTAGHVVIYVPNKGFYSSPYTSTQTHYIGASIQDIEAKYSCRYLGWSEDINKVRVAKGVDMDCSDAIQIAEVRAGYLAQVALAAGVDPNKPIEQKEVTQIVKNIDEKNKRIVAQSAQILGLTQTVNEKELEIEELQDEVISLKEENKELKAELALVSQDTANLNKLGESLMWILTRLGLKK